MNRILGELNKGLGIFLDYLFEIIIGIVSTFVTIFKSFQQILAGFLVFGGCLFILILFNPFFLQRTKGLPLFILLIMVFPIIGKIAVSYLKYLQYIVTENFYERADNYLLGVDRPSTVLGNYGFREERRLERARQEAQQRAWEQEQERRRAQEEAFRQIFEEFIRGGGSFQWQYGPYTGEQGSYGGQQGGQRGYSSPSQFKLQYEGACDILGVPYTADKYEIRLAYRQKAKEYHPDLNKAENATEMFQKANAANEFLSDENIKIYHERYVNNQ